MPRLLLAAILALLAPVLSAHAALAQTCTTSWTNPAGGSWQTATNWSDGLPDAADVACIALAGTYTVAQSSADRTVAGLIVGGASGTQTLTTFNTFTVSGNAVVRPSGRWELLNRTPGGADGVLTTGTITVEGVLVQNSGTTLLGTAGVLDVAPGGTLRVVGNGVGAGGAGSLFRIRGTLEATDCPLATSSGSCQVTAPLDVQGGTVRAAGGVFFVLGGGTLANATVDAAAGASLYLNGTPAALAVSGTLSGAPAGAVFLNGGTVTAAPGETMLAVAGAGLQLAGNVVLAGGAYRNTGLITVAGGGFNALDGTTLRNEGRFVMPGITFSLRTGARLRNEAAGTIEVSNQGGIGFNGGVDGRVENAGLLLANGSPAGPGSGATAGTISVPYDGLPGSVVRTQTGRLDFQTGGSLRDATFAVPTGTVILLGAVFVAEGTVGGDIQGDLQINTELRAAAAGATLAFGGTGVVASRGSFSPVLFTSAGGSFRNTGLIRTGGLGLALQQVVLENAGTVRLETRFNLMNGALLRNLAGATVELYAFMEGDGRFENAGLAVTAGTGFSASFGGRLRSLPGSELRALAGGPRLDLDAPASRTLPDGTTLSGTGRVLFAAALEPEGTVSPGTYAQPVATLASFNAYRPSLVAGSPRLVIDVDAGGQSDVFAVGGGATRLGGALVVRVRPGYVPAIGDQWTILTNGTSAITGQFGQVVAEGAPSGIAFVAELAPGGTSLVVRAVTTAPGGAITVSTTAPVGGGVRPVFLTGPGAAGVSAARLDCVECLDPGAFGTIPAQIVGAGALREARFDLTSPRAFGLYSLVVQSPGQPDVVTAVTVRPYLSFTLPTGGFVRGLRVRPAGTGYNWSFLSIGNRTNASEPAYPFQRVERALPSETGLAIASGNAFVPGVVVFYESDTTPDPLDPPIVFGRIPAGEEVMLNTGLRIDPDAVLFPEQTPSGPDDPRVPFGESLPVNAVGAFHASFARSASVVEAALRATGNGALGGYLASVDAADPTAVAAGVRDAMQESGARYLGTPLGLLQRVVVLLSATAPPPSGLAAAAGLAFDAALKAEATVRLADMRAVIDEIASAPASVRTLYEGEAAALLPEFVAPRAPTGSAHRGGVAEGFQCNFENNANGVGSILDSPELNGGGGGGGGGGGVGTCQPTRGDADPNDKTADTDLRCEFGTVVVSGEAVTRCVRYYVPLARAGDPIGYTVQFENLAIATEPAEFITITDELDPSLNPATLEVLGTSSDSTFSYSVSGQTVTFRFVGINLPPNVTAPEGEGYVRFRVRPFAALADGTEVRNDASIVFSFNPPIVTPEVVHLVRQTADLATVVEAPDEARVGQPAMFRVLVGNFQGDPAETPTATLTVSGGTVLSAIPESGSCSEATPVVCTFADLDSTAVVSIAVTVQPTASGPLSVSSVVDTPSFDGFAANDTDASAVTVTGVGTEPDPLVPRELTLSSPRPNPAHGQTTLRWGLPAAAAVDVRIYDLLGREVARIAEGETQEAGWHETRWDAQVASGVYIVRVRVGDDVRTRRMTVIR